MTDRRDSSNAQGSSFLQGALNVNISGGTMVGTQNFNNTGNPLNLLYSKVAHNAILNAGGRADEVKCHPGTRIEVLSKVKGWRDEGSSPMFWLSGPAGAGKSAIIQTFAEEYITSTLIMINFFFFRADSTRNHISRLVATLIFQILNFYPNAKMLISGILAEMPYIFEMSIHDQFHHLIINPISALREKHNDTRPIVLLIDGLDECGTERNERNEEQQIQARLVQILNDLVSTPASPFIALVSSRPEAHVTRAFYEIEGQYSSIFLDNEYLPSDDIRTYLTAEFARIKRAHNLRHTIDARWPSLDDIEEIVGKSSGQFIYAATVIRFLSSSPASPARSLDQIKGIYPAKRYSPFAALDAVYVHILAQTDDLDVLKVILSAQIICNMLDVSLIATIKPLGYTLDDITAHTATLGALMQLDGKKLEFYHASLVDFLTDATRSGDFFLDIPAFYTTLAAAHFTNKVHNNCHDLMGTLGIAWDVTVSSPAFEDALAAFSPQDLVFEFEGNVAYCYSFLKMLHRVYSVSNERFYEALLRKWLPYFHKSDVTADRLELDQIKLGLEIWAEIAREQTGWVETIQSETVQSETVQSETGQSETVQSETVLSETVQSEAVKTSKQRHKKVSRILKGLFKKS